MPLISVNRVVYYDARLDGEAVRLSGFDHRGGEYWISELIAPAGKSRRLQQERALSAISEAIDAGLEPGQVIVE